MKQGGLWQNADFLKFWTGETISLVGSQITGLALPLMAAVTFEATPVQMGILNASQFAPFLVATLFAGVFIDRSRRRPILIGANLGRSGLLCLIPVSGFLGLLRMEHLYLITFLAGLLSVLFELAYLAYVPSLVGRTELVEGNSKLQASASLAQVGGPGLAGLLISAVTAPVAILLDAFSYLISALTLGLIRRPEPRPEAPRERGSIWQEIRDGARVVYANPYLRAIAGEAATFNTGSQITWSVLVLYLTRELHLDAKLLGAVLATASLGSVAGSLIAGWLGRRLGTGPAILWAMVVGCASPILVPLAAGPLSVALPVVVLSFFLGGMGLTVSVVHVVSLRQSIIPLHLMGRASASYRFLTYGIAPVGALLGGALGEWIGLRMTLAVGALGTLSALLWVIFSPVPGLRRLPTGEEPDAA